MIQMHFIKLAAVNPDYLEPMKDYEFVFEDPAYARIYNMIKDVYLEDSEGRYQIKFRTISCRKMTFFSGRLWKESYFLKTAIRSFANVSKRYAMRSFRSARMRYWKRLRF